MKIPLRQPDKQCGTIKTKGNSIILLGKQNN
jgi:hypothetical protein